MWTYVHSDELYHSYDELYHYGVKGMRWGHKKLDKYSSKASTARESAKEWDEMARYAKQQGKLKKAAKYSKRAKADLADAAKYDSKSNEVQGYLNNKYGSKIEKKYAKAGKLAGREAYYREYGKAKAKEHEDRAKLFDQQAKKSEAQGDIWRAEASRKAAAALRERGANVKAENDRIADSYAKSVTRSKEKASKYATKARVDIGQKRVNEIIKANKKKGYESERARDEWEKEQTMRERYGDDGYDAYNRVRGVGQRD